MPRVLRYADAVRLLGGDDSRLVDALDKLTAGAMLGAAVPFPAVLGWFDARAEFVRLSRQLVRNLAERRGGLSRYDRTQRLEAAHAVIVVTAYFEVLAEADLPVRFADLELTTREQIVIGGGGAAVERGRSTVPQAVFAMDTLRALPYQPHDERLGSLLGYYAGVSDSVAGFLSGLAVWERLTDRDRRRLTDVLDGLPPVGCRRYEELFRQLATDFPEVAFWSTLGEHSATRAHVRDLGTALAGLGRLLADISTGRVPDERRVALARANAAALDRPIVESGDAPPGLTVPTLGDAYVSPRFRVSGLGPGARASDERWWARHDPRDDLTGFLTGYLTSSPAVRAPLVVLGQPGSGKSVLTRVLAARLPAADFLPVRVTLRDVPADGEIQDQIEHAIRAETGERLDWPALSRSAGGALPVVMLDGFDELLQATGVNQSDYLTRVAAFQRRELEQGRPVVVLVTTRTSVADRARAPEDTVGLRLEPFDGERIAAWLRTWNAANAGYFAAGKLSPLTLDAVLPHRALAEQPLLLLMLALYDADGNALRQLAAGPTALERDELYERLLRRFARREVTKHRPELPDRDLDRAVEDELRRLSLVAFAMFNRNSQWVTEVDLAADLSAVLGEAPTAAPDLRAPLGRAEIVLGRFFFVHRARAVRDADRLATYEFLHATFGEFLVARMTFLAIRDLVAREAAAMLSFAAQPVDDDLLHALLSFAPLTARTPIIGFLRGMLSRLAPVVRDEWRDLLVRLFRVVHQPRPPRKLDGYQPRALPVPARYAAYSANLLFLAVHAAGELRVGELYGATVEDPVVAWKRQAMLWRSQLMTWDDWTGPVEALAVERTYDGDRRDLVLRPDDGTFAPPAVDLSWTYELPVPDYPDGEHLVPGNVRYLRRRTHFLCRNSDDTITHALEPMMELLPVAATTLLRRDNAPPRSLAHALIDLWLLPLRSGHDRTAAYRRGVRLLAAWRPSGSRAHRLRDTCVQLLANSLIEDPTLPPARTAALMRELLAGGPGDEADDWASPFDVPATEIPDSAIVADKLAELDGVAGGQSWWWSQLRRRWRDWEKRVAEGDGQRAADTPGGGPDRDG